MVPMMRDPNPDLMRIKARLDSGSGNDVTGEAATLFLTKHAHLAIVVTNLADVGWLTLENVLEEWSATFKTSSTRTRRNSADQRERIHGGRRARLYELNDLAKLDRERGRKHDRRYVTHLLGHLPKQGEQVKIDNTSSRFRKRMRVGVRQLHFKKLSDASKPAEPATKLDVAL